MLVNVQLNNSRIIQDKSDQSISKEAKDSTQLTQGKDSSVGFKNPILNFQEETHPYIFSFKLITPKVCEKAFGLSNTC